MEGWQITNKNKVLKQFQERVNGEKGKNNIIKPKYTQLNYKI